MKIYKRPTRDGLWHPVMADGTVVEPVDVTRDQVRDFETGELTGRWIVSTYTFGSEERRDAEDHIGCRWIPYKAPKKVEAIR